MITVGLENKKKNEKKFFRDPTGPFSKWPPMESQIFKHFVRIFRF